MPTTPEHCQTVRDDHDDACAELLAAEAETASVSARSDELIGRRFELTNLIALAETTLVAEVEQELVSQIKADPKGAYFEIEGHTDNVGDAKVNEKIGLERAEAVKRYLYEQHQIPLLPLYADGYTSIGCQPCTSLPLDPSNDRSGRWGGQKLECGIHIQAVK